MVKSVRGEDKDSLRANDDTDLHSGEESTNLDNESEDVEDDSSKDVSEDALDNDEHDNADGNEDKPAVVSIDHKGNVPSFESLRKEHDMIIVARLVLTVVVAVILLIPIPISMIGAKFVMFALLAYASIYNEVDLRKEHELRKDEFSRKAHVASYVAFTVVLVLFLLLAVIAGAKVNYIVDVTNQVINAYNAAGLGPIIVK
jgi:hypothetical protein